MSACCGTFIQQWQQCVQTPHYNDAADDDTEGMAYYYATMLQALNNLQAILAAQAELEEQEREQDE